MFSVVVRASRAGVLGGYEYDSKATPRERSDQDPIYKAAIQLATAYLGFIERRMWEFGNKGNRPARPEGVNLLERYVPVLVTNAPLRFINAGAVQIDLQSGSVVNHPVVETVPFVILSQPAAIPGAADDFRKNVPGEDWHLRFNESIYVVNAGALTQFFGTGHRYFLMNCKSEERHPDAAAESPIAPQVWAHSED